MIGTISGSVGLVNYRLNVQGRKHPQLSFNSMGIEGILTPNSVCNAEKRHLSDLLKIGVTFVLIMVGE